jgi:LmbE family N-acetylglucosaminyl deacetylase
MTKNKKLALVLIAHADDETLGAGGTILKLIEKGWIVNIVAISDGKITVRGKKQDNSKNFEEACKFLGVEKYSLLKFKDQKYDTLPISDLVNAVEKLKLQPDLIITHNQEDLNKDHRITCEVAKIIGRPKTKPISILGCEIPGSSFWNGKVFQANYFVDITKHIDLKIDAFAKYHNEIQEYPHPWSKKGLKLLAQYHGMQSGFKYAEAFNVIRGYEERLL